jgi:hypothetical protein
MIQAGDLVRISDPKALLPKLYGAVHTLLMRKYGLFIPNSSLPIDIDTSKNWWANRLQVVGTYGRPKVVNGELVFDPFVVCRSEIPRGDVEDSLTLPENAVELVARPKFSLEDRVKVSDTNYGDYCVFLVEGGDSDAVNRFLKVGSTAMVVDQLQTEDRFSTPPTPESNFYVGVLFEGDSSYTVTYMPDHMLEAVQ